MNGWTIAKYLFSKKWQNGVRTIINQSYLTMRQYTLAIFRRDSQTVHIFSIVLITVSVCVCVCRCTHKAMMYGRHWSSFLFDIDIAGQGSARQMSIE